MLPVPLADVVLELSIFFLQPPHLVQVGSQAVVEVLHGDLLVAAQQGVSPHPKASCKPATKASSHPGAEASCQAPSEAPSEAASAHAPPVADAARSPRRAPPAYHGGGISPAGDGGAPATATTADASRSSAPVGGTRCSLDAAAHGGIYQMFSPECKAPAQLDRENQSAAFCPRWCLFIRCWVGVTSPAAQLPMKFASPSAHAKSDVLRGISFGTWDSPPHRYCVCMLIHRKHAV